MEELESTSAEKDTLIAKYEAIVKEIEGDSIGWYEIHDVNFPKHYIVYCNN